MPLERDTENEIKGARSERQVTGVRVTSVTCPCCGMTSHNPSDVFYGYCANCHLYHLYTSKQIFY